MGLSIQKNKFKINFQDSNFGGHLVFPIGTILVIFDQQVTSITLTKFQDNWPFGSGAEAICFLTSFESIGLSIQGKK